MRVAFLAVLSVMLVSAVRAEDWPQWRGADGDGIAKGEDWSPEAIGAGKVLWEKQVGAGYSGVAVVGQRAFTMGNAGDNDIVYAINTADGSEVWKYSYPCGAAKSYPGPRCTPAVDVKTGLLYVLSREGELYCLDAVKGTLKWKKDIKKEFGAKPPKWAFSSSPRIHGELLLVNEGEKGIVLNKTTGAKVWSGGGGIGGYSSPVVYKKDGKEYLAVFSSKHVYGLDLKTGAEAWSYPWETSYDVNAADPVVVGDEIFISSGYGRGCALLDISGTVRAVWENKAISSHFGSLVYKDGYVYGLDGQAGSKRSEIKCVDFHTGEQKWAEKTGFGALVGADDKIIFLGDAGLLKVLDMSPDGYSERASGQVQINGKCWSMPILAGGRLYCRSDKGHLLCLSASK